MLVLSCPSVECGLIGAHRGGRGAGARGARDSSFFIHPSSFYDGGSNPCSACKFGSKLKGAIESKVIRTGRLKTGKWDFPPFSCLQSFCLSAAIPISRTWRQSTGSSSALWTLDFGLWTLDFGLWTLGCGVDWLEPFVGSAGEFGPGTPVRGVSRARERVAPGVSRASDAPGWQGPPAFGVSRCQPGEIWRIQECQYWGLTLALDTCSVKLLIEPFILFLASPPFIGCGFPGDDFRSRRQFERRVGSGNLAPVGKSHCAAPLTAVHSNLCREKPVGSEWGVAECATIIHCHPLRHGRAERSFPEGLQV